MFSATYQNYLILLNITTTAGDDNDCLLRLRVSGTDTTTNYSSLRIANSRTGTTPAGNTDTGGTGGYFLFPTDKDENGASKARIEIFSPFEASTSTFFLSQSIGNYSNNTFNQILSGKQSATTQYTGFTILAGSNLTGTVRTYGYNQ